MKKAVLGLALCAALSFSACAGGSASSSASSSSSESSSQETSKEDAENLFGGIKLKADTDVRKSFMDVSVHDPSVLKVGDTYYIFGSHLAAAKTTDLMHWTLIDSGVKKDNKIIPDAMTEMKEAFDWAKTTTFWAPDVKQLEDGKFYMYYCNCEGSSPLSALGVAVSDNVEGPYKNLGIILKSGMGADTPSEDGDTYNASVQPNAIDPCVFYGKDGRLW
ncbi:MAG TPA: family 43 glycosylhydrolase, partial [Oscillospiraceae bacterium]|nr:family 43 glycosylhydrolase [Oscillospiraceae bacterium]